MDPNKYGNDRAVEANWAVAAFSFAERHWDCLSGLPLEEVRMTHHDEAIYTAFRQTFPDMAIEVINEEEMKSEDGETTWRHFLERDEVKVWIGPDFNFGTLLRVDCREIYNEKNTVLALRGQFYAIEVARNREGANDWIRGQHRPSKTNDR